MAIKDIKKEVDEIKGDVEHEHAVHHPDEKKG